MRYHSSTPVNGKMSILAVTDLCIHSRPCARYRLGSWYCTGIQECVPYAVLARFTSALAPTGNLATSWCPFCASFWRPIARDQASSVDVSTVDLVQWVALSVGTFLTFPLFESQVHFSTKTTSVEIHSISELALRQCEVIVAPLKSATTAVTSAE